MSETPTPGTVAPHMAHGIVAGRERELAAIEASLRTVRDGLSMLAISGDPGIGKTRLWQAAIASARGHGYTVLACRPGEAETDLPYAGLDDLLRPVPSSVLERLAPPLRHALDVALLRAAPDRAPSQQRAVGLATHALLSELADDAPVVVAIDDAQWLDPPSRMVLRFALRRLEQLPLGVVVAVRGDRYRDDVIGLDRVLVEDRGVRLHLGPLDAAVVGEIVADRFARRLSRSELAALHHQSGGNPLFALEIASAMQRGAAPVALGQLLPVPASLRDLLSDRLFHLPGPVRDLLGVVAALSRPTISLVRAALDQPGEFDQLLDRAAAAGVLDVDNERLSFTHPLLRSVLYTDLTIEQRRRLHRRLAEVSTDIEEHARHMALAADGPDALVANALTEAATRARARGAPDAAADLAEQAARFTPPDADDDRRARTILAADSYLEAGDTGPARLLLEELVAGTPPGVGRASASLALSRVRSYDGGHVASAEILERALAHAAGHDELTAHIERDLSTALVQSGDVREALPHAYAALAAAERVRSPRLLVPALAGVAMVEFLVGNGLRGDLMHRATALGPNLPTGPADPGFLPTDLVWGGLLKWADDFDGARARFRALHRRVERLAQESTWGSMLFQAGELELWSGRFDAAESCAMEIDHITERSAQTAQRSHAAYLRAAVAAHRGQLDWARDAGAVALTEADRACDLRFRIRALALLGFIELAADRPGDALDYLDRASTEYADAGYGDPGVVRFQIDLVEALVAVNELERATTLLAAFEARGHALGRPRVLALAARGRGLVLGQRGELQQARAVLQTSVEQLEPLPHTFELARSLLALGVVQRRTKQKRPARESLERATSIFDDLGAASFAQRARAEGARIGGRPSSRNLSPTEAEVADLVGAGLSNAEVAHDLFMSVKTVENTLTRVYRKLGVRSRRDLVRRHLQSPKTEPDR